MLLAFSAAIFPTQAAPPLRLVVGGEQGDNQCRYLWGPYLVLHEILSNRLKVVYTCTALPWARAQREVENGVYDGFVSILSAERKRYAQAHTIPLFTTKMYLYMRADDPRRVAFDRHTDLALLKELHFVTAVGDNWAKTHLQPLGIAIDWANGTIGTLKKIESHRGDVTIDTPAAIDPFLIELGLTEKIVRLNGVIDQADSFLMLNKSSPYIGLLNDVDKSLKAMKADGSLSKLTKEKTARPKRH